jgi:hypothetical protein
VELETIAFFQPLLQQGVVVAHQITPLMEQVVDLAVVAVTVPMTPVALETLHQQLLAKEIMAVTDSLLVPLLVAVEAQEQLVTTGQQMVTEVLVLPHLLLVHLYQGLVVGVQVAIRLALEVLEAVALVQQIKVTLLAVLLILAVAAVAHETLMVLEMLAQAAPVLLSSKSHRHTMPHSHLA